MRPMRLRNTEGRWRVIVNKIGLYDQTVRVETCLNNGSNCRLLPPCFNTQVLDRVVRIQFVKNITSPSFCALTLKLKLLGVKNDG